MQMYVIYLYRFACNRYNIYTYEIFIIYGAYLYRIFIARYILTNISMYIAINILYRYAPHIINISYIYIYIVSVIYKSV